MRLIFRLCYILFFASSLLFIVSSSVSAEGEFETDYKVKYTVDKNGLTSVNQDITLKNKTANFYADKFELKIGSTKINDIKASDDTGELETEVKFENNVTTIGVKFKQKVIGSGKSLNWKLSYNSNELATKSGQIWEISIPKLAKSSDTGIYEATVSVPRIFGPIAFAAPTPISQNQASQSQEFFFNKDQLVTSGISLSFGEKQVFSFKLNYFLENKNITNQIQEISLPPDNNYQKIVLEKINPKPIDVSVDDDGNFLAKYKLAPKEKINIAAEGHVEVFSKPFRKIVKNLSTSQENLYTQPQQYWETDNSFIKEKAQELKTPEKIYEFVSTYLNYNNERLNSEKIERKGAAAAFSSPKDSVCMEFTDLFIAIARAAKIPAREVEGFAYTQNERLRPLSLSLYEGDVLHAWPEYWDSELGWVQIDPTWGATSGGLDYLKKLDFNHITFVQRGISSTTPFPAGAFTEDSKKSEKTVFVSFAKDLPTPTSNAQINIDSPQRAYALLPLKAIATITNTGSTSIIGETLTLSHGRLTNKSPNPVDIPILPPFSSKPFTFYLETSNWLNGFQEALIFTYAGTEVSKPIKIEPFYKVVIEPTFVFSIIGAVLIIGFGLYLYKRTHKKHQTA